MPAHYADADVGINVDKDIYEVRLGSKNRILDWMRAAGHPYAVSSTSLALAEQHRLPVHVLTKSALVERDLDVLGELATVDATSVWLSVTTLDDDAAAPIGSTCPPIGGRYTTQPAGGLDAFDGLIPDADWTLQITDTQANGRTGS